LGKIFKYELKRLLLSKLYIALLIVNGIFAWYVLSADIIMGVAFTAPFSMWSFGGFMAAVMPMGILTMLFLMSFYYSTNERLVEELTTATPAPKLKYMLVRNGVVALGFLVICLMAVALSVYFYVSIFGFSNFAGFVLPGIITVLPGFMFFMGFGALAGRIRPGVLYALIPAVFLVGFGAGPVFLDVFGGGYYGNAPLDLPVGIDGEPGFVLSLSFMLSRVFFLVAGGIMWFISLRPGKQEV